LSALQRALASHKEKIAWCEPEPNSDRYNLEAKLTSLDDIAHGLADCARRQAEFAQSVEQLRVVETSPALRELSADRELISKELAALNESYKAVRSRLERGAAQWKLLEARAETVGTWLKEAETRMRAEMAHQADLAQLDSRIKEVRAFLKEVQNHVMQDTFFIHPVCCVQAADGAPFT